MALLGNLVGLIGLLAAIWVIYDVLAKQKRMKTFNKIVWVVCALLFSIITALVYYLIVKKK
jgi:hypothetical protein